MKIKITELEEKVSKLLKVSGMSDQDAETFTSLVVEQEMVGNQFSPVGELAGKHARLIKNLENIKEEVIVNKNSLKLVKGNGRLAPLITADYLEETINKAKENGIYALGIYDSTYNEFFDIFARRVASKDCIALIFENGGPQGVVPFGGKKDITGTNPIAFGIPTHKYPIIFDGSTAMHAWGRIRQAKERRTNLPENAYIDADGNLTTDPNLVAAILPFGGFKGYAINVLVEVLSGALVRGKSGLEQPSDSQRYIGTLMIVIDPSSFGDIKDFKDQTSKLVQDLLSVPPVNPKMPVKVPGIRGSKRMEEFKKNGELEIDDYDWKKFSESLERIND